jgi:hypothetical protein
VLHGNILETAGEIGLIAFGPALGNLTMRLRQTVRAAFGPALGNLTMRFRQTVRAAFGPALGNLTMRLRQTVRATEGRRQTTGVGEKAGSEEQGAGKTGLSIRGPFAGRFHKDL